MDSALSLLVLALTLDSILLLDGAQHAHVVLLINILGRPRS